MVLIAGVIAVGFVTGIIGGIVQAVLPTIIAKVLGGTVWVGGTRLLGLAPTSRETTATWRASLGQRCRGTSWALASRAGAAVDIDERESPQSRFPPPPAYGPVAISGPPQATQPVSRQNLRSAHQPSLFTSEDFHRSSKSRARKYTSPSPCGPNENPGSLRQRLACLGHIACDRAAHTAHSVNQGRLGTLAPALVELRNRKTFLVYINRKVKPEELVEPGRSHVEYRSSSLARGRPCCSTPDFEVPVQRRPGYPVQLRHRGDAHPGADRGLRGLQRGVGELARPDQVGPAARLDELQS
jgi:hypothetical protein